ncbi:hypothetical protein LFL97_10005 [Burkholderia sp. JSH-S8]|nr:hypothetical protein LFL97_10005 [Burkholderia sp. JSH-S8]
MHPALARPRKLTYAFGNVSMFTHVLPGAFSLVTRRASIVYRHDGQPRRSRERRHDTIDRTAQPGGGRPRKRRATNHPRKPHWSIPRRPVRSIAPMPAERMLYRAVFLPVGSGSAVTGTNHAVHPGNRARLHP